MFPLSQARSLALIFAGVHALAGCTGSIGAPVALGGGEGSGHQDSPIEFAPAPPSLHRLTVSQYQGSVRDLLGHDLVVPTDLELDTPLHGFSTVGAGELTISPHAAEQFEAAALSLAGQVFGDDARRTALLGCAPTDPADPCIRSFLERFGRRVWRRPLSIEELDQLGGLTTTIAGTFGDVWKGLEYALAAMLQSPFFLFRVDRGEVDPDDPEHLRYDGWEMATRMSYLLWNSTPDDELLDAAARGDLVTDEGLRAQAERMLASSRAQSAIGLFWSEFLTLDRLDHLEKDPGLFPAMSPTLGASMRGEIERMFSDVVFDRDADFRELFDTRTTFVNHELADLYGLSLAQVDYARVELPDDGPRGGLMTTAGVLALYARVTMSSPTLRGRFIRTNLLCEDIPPPPPGVQTDLQATGGEGPRTMRQRLEVHRSNPSCSGCHMLMDPLGLALEHFDAVGAWRDTDNGLVLDTTAEIDGVAFDGARELGALLRQNPKVGACVARRLFRYATGHLEIESEQPAIEELAADFGAAEFRLKALLVDLVLSKAFRTASEVE